MIIKKIKVLYLKMKINLRKANLMKKISKKLSLILILKKVQALLNRVKIALNQKMKVKMKNLLNKRVLKILLNLRLPKSFQKNQKAKINQNNKQKIL